MSTRSNIKLIDNCGEILLYKHHDGSPADMTKFIGEFLKRSGKSAEWMAQLMIKETEVEVSCGIHGDIAYYYEVNVKDDTIDAFERNWNTDEKVFLRTYDLVDLEATTQ